MDGRVKSGRDAALVYVPLFASMPSTMSRSARAAAVGSSASESAEMTARPSAPAPPCRMPLWMSALDEVRQKFPDRYVDNYVMLARVIRLEADVKHSLAKPKTVEEAPAELESRVGTKGRRKFEKFLREVAEDEDEDVIDVESK